MTIKPKTIEELSKLPLAMAAEYHDPKEHDLSSEDLYVRGLRHGFVQGIKHTLFEQDFYKDQQHHNDRHPAYQAGYSAGWDDGYDEGREEHTAEELREELLDAKALIKHLEKQLEDVRKKSFDEGYEKALEEQSVW